jgi:tRNA(Ile)-lysidine synthase
MRMTSARPITVEEAGGLLAPLARFDRVALAVSGGPDSLALMHLAARWRAAQNDGPELSVLTVDHGLRTGSRDEALSVGRAAAALSLPHAILAWESRGDVTTGVQAKARAARYDLMTAHAVAHDIGALVTAHHLDDQAETFLMRLKRGSGLDGLAAIPATGTWGPLTLLRPLLDVPKARLVATVEAAGLAFARDPSNADTSFERVRLRGATDAFAKLGLTPEAVALSAKRLRRARSALDDAAQEFLSRHAEMNDAGYAVLGQAALSTCPEEIALRALSRLLASVGGGEDPVRLAKLEALLAALRSEPGKAHTLGRCRIAPLAGRLGIFREMRRGGLPELDLHPGEGALWDNRFRVALGAAAPRALTVRALGETGWRQLRDAEALPQSLPRLAARALPACWRGDRLLGLADFGQAPQGAAPCSRHEDRLDCQAIFLRGAIREPRPSAAAPLNR